MTSEREIVLHAITGGASTVPAISRATGLKYAKLYPVLEQLAGWEVSRIETSDGFDRFYPLGAQPSEEDGREPYCVQCRRKCYPLIPIGIARNSEYLKWRCSSCGHSFDGTRASKLGKKMRKLMGHISTDAYAAADARVAEIIENGKRPSYAAQGLDEESKKISVKRPGGRFSGTRTERMASNEEVASAAGRNRFRHVDLGDEEEETLAAMRDEDERVEEPAVEAEAVGSLAQLVEEIETAPAFDIPTKVIPTKEGLQSDAARVLTGVTLEGGLKFNIDVRISAEELASWSPVKIANFFNGLATIVAARK